MIMRVNVLVKLFILYFHVISLLASVKQVGEYMNHANQI